MFKRLHLLFCIFFVSGILVCEFQTVFFIFNFKVIYCLFHSPCSFSVFLLLCLFLCLVVIFFLSLLGFIFLAVLFFFIFLILLIFLSIILLILLFILLLIVLFVLLLIGLFVLLFIFLIVCCILDLLLLIFLLVYNSNIFHNKFIYLFSSWRI